MLANLITKPHLSKPANITIVKSINPASTDSSQAHQYPTNLNLPNELKPHTNRFNISDRVILKDRYLIVDFLGSGGMSEVYKARDLHTEKSSSRQASYVAIKVLSDRYHWYSQDLELLTVEAAILKRVSHPNMVKVYAIERDEDVVFMTMEYVDGVTLDDVIRQHPSRRLPEQYVNQVIKDMVSALSHVHQQQIVHSDLKPDNVLVTGEGKAQLFDFGMSRNMRPLNPRVVNGHGGRLKPEEIWAFTPAYASLEMITGAGPDVRDDIYGLGCIAYELLMGKHPYQRIPADQAERQGRRARRISHIKKNQWLAIKKALEFRKEDRTPTVKCFYDEYQQSV